MDKSQMIKIIIDKHGNIIWFKEEKTKALLKNLELKKKQEERVSYISPQNIILRILFKIIRKIFKNNEKIIQWTRSWNCKWQVEIPEIKLVKKNFTDRQKAIEFEKEIIIKYTLSEKLMP